MDYKEMIEELKTHAFDRDPELYCTPFECGAFGLCSAAATAIETLLAERDAAAEDLHGVCRACVNAGQFEGAEPCSDCTYGTGIMWDDDNWQWRGPAKGEAK